MEQTPVVLPEPARRAVQVVAEDTMDNQEVLELQDKETEVDLVVLTDIMEEVEAVGPAQAQAQLVVMPDQIRYQVLQLHMPAAVAVAEEAVPDQEAVVVLVTVHRAEQQEVDQQTLEVGVAVVTGMVLVEQADQAS